RTTCRRYSNLDFQISTSKCRISGKSPPYCFAIASNVDLSRHLTRWHDIRPYHSYIRSRKWSLGQCPRPRQGPTVHHPCDSLAIRDTEAAQRTSSSGQRLLGRVQAVEEDLRRALDKSAHTSGPGRRRSQPPGG